MATVATLQTNLALNSTAFRTGMIQAANQANTSLGSIQQRAKETASVLLSLKSAAETFGSFYLLKEGIGSLLEAQVQLQQIRYTLISATSSTAQADQAFEYLRATSQKLGLDLQPTSQEFGKLAAAAEASGVSLTQTEQLFTAFGQASTVLHLSSIQSQRALLALTEMMSRGTIQSRQLNQQLGQAIPGSAARFKNAVMEATKGTDLAGKSFEKLLQGGKLVTSQFLPEMIQALTESGKGWEEASTGLNANLNRVKTSWFNLKTELSGGLFNDAATAGAGLLADNLHRVASSIELVAAVAAVRTVIGIGTKAVGSVTSAVAERAAAVASAEALSIKTQATLADTAATQRQMEAQAREAQFNVEAIQQNTDAIASTNLRAEAISNLGLTSVESANLQAKAALTVAVAQQRQVEGDALLAESELKKQEGVAAATVGLLRYQVELDALGVAKERQTVANVALYESNQRVTQATLAAAEAEGAVRVAALEKLEAATVVAVKANLSMVASDGKLVAADAAAAESATALAAARERASAGGALAGVGNGLMSLVGGPIGAAVLAVGALGLAFLSARDDAEKLVTATKDSQRELTDQTLQVQQMNDAYRTLGNADSLAPLKDGLQAIGKEMDDNIVKIKAQQDQLDAMHAAQTQGKGTLFGMDTKWDVTAAAYSFVVDKLSGKQAALAANTEDLRSKQEQLLTDYNSDNATLIEKYGSAWAGVRDEISNTSLSMSGLLQLFGDLPGKMADAQKSMAGIDAGLATYQKYADGLVQLEESTQKKLRQKSMTGAQMMADDHAQALKAAKAGGVTESPEQSAEYQGALEAQKKLDALSHRSKAAKADPSIQAYKDLKDAQDAQLVGLQQQLDGTDKLSGAQQKLNKLLTEQASGNTKLTKTDLTLAIAEQQHIVALTNQVALRQQSIAFAKKEADMAAELAAAQALRDQTAARKVEGVGHGSEWNQQKQEQEALTDSFNKRIEAENKAYDAEIAGAKNSGTLAQNQAGYDKDHLAMIAQITAAQKLATASQTKDFAALEAANANAMSGMKSAVEDYMTAQQNMAEITKQATTSALSGFGDAFTQFATGAKSAKDAFGSFIDSMYEQAMRVVANKAIQALLDSFGGSGDKATPGSTTGGWTSIFSNFMNAWGSGGGMGGGGFASFGANMAVGGTVQPGSFHQVNENGPELYSQGGKTYLMGGDKSGQVTPITGGQGTMYITNINVQPTSTRRTADQIATANARAQRVATTRNG